MALIKGRWAGYGANAALTNMPKLGLHGLLQDCKGGTVFIDELDETTLDFQTFLLDILDRKPIPLTVGRGEPVIPDVRLIFATNKDPEELVRTGKLRADLWRRIRGRVITIPPLARRKEDILLFVRKMCGEHVPTPRFLLALLQYDWPGNVGELIDVLNLAVSKTKSSTDTLTIEHLEINNSIIAMVHEFGDEQAEEKVYLLLQGIFEQQGLRKGAGLLKRIAETLGISEATASRKAAKYLSSEESRH